MVPHRYNRGNILLERTDLEAPFGSLLDRSSLLAFHFNLHVSFFCEKVARAISTGLLSPSPNLHILPINVVVSHDPLGKIHLEDGFALRCFQRLS